MATVFKGFTTVSDVAETSDPRVTRASHLPGAPDRIRPTVAEGLRTALCFLFPINTRGKVRAAFAFESAHVWFVPVGLLIGLAWAGLFKSTWRLYGEVASLRVIPPLAIVIVESLITGPFLMLGLARTVNLLTSARPWRPPIDATEPLSPAGTLALVLSVLSLWVFIASIPPTSGWWPPPDDWRYPLRHLYPAPIYRSLVLAPIWGRWAILLAGTVGRTAKYADDQTVALCRPLAPGRLLLHTIFPMTITSAYLSRDGNYLTGIIVGMIVFLAAYVPSVVMARRGGGQTRQSLYAVGLVGQLTFLAAYRAFWPLVHG